MGGKRKTMNTPAFLLLVGKKMFPPKHLDWMPLISAIVVMELMVPSLSEKDK